MQGALLKNALKVFYTPCCKTIHFFKHSDKKREYIARKLIGLVNVFLIYAK